MKKRERDAPFNVIPLLQFQLRRIMYGLTTHSIYLEGGKEGRYIYATSVFKAGLLIRSVHLLSSLFPVGERCRGDDVKRRDADPWLALREIERITMGLYLWLRSWSNRFRADCLRSVPIARNAACTIASGTPPDSCSTRTCLLTAVFDILACVTRVFTSNTITYLIALWINQLKLFYRV